MNSVSKLLLILCALIALTGCRDQYQEAREKCAVDYPKTVDYIQCVNKVNQIEEQDSADAALISTTIMLSTAATIQ